MSRPSVIRSDMPSAVAARKPFTRWQASGLHLGISAVIAAAALAVMLGVWFPRPLFEAEGGPGLVLILVGVDVVIGPLVTLVIFKSGKPGLKFDLWVIAALQLSALAYGCYVVAKVRPVFIVFVKDQFEIVTPADLDAGDLAQARRPEYRSLSVTGPVLVAADPPADEKERQEVMFAALAGGKDFRHYPKYYVPYAEYAKVVVGKGQTLERLRSRDPRTAEVVADWLARSGTREADVLYLPLKASRGWVAALVHAKSGALVKMLLGPPG